jgi:5-formyltetrahydrofolate cyclo-ligase
VLLVPALAVDRAGRRLGRGGGYYDRALARLADDPIDGTAVDPPDRVAVVALLHDGEILDAIPTDPWDRPVTAAVTPHGWFDLGQA